MPKNICYFVGTHGDWGGASRILFNLIRNIDRRRFTPIVMLSQEGPICGELRNLSVDYYVWGNHDYKNPVRYAADMAKCFLFFRKKNIHLIHLNHTCIGWRPAEIQAAKVARIPVVMHCQQPVIKPSPDLLNSTLVLTCSEYLSRVSDTAKVPKRVVYDAVDLTKYGAGKSVPSDFEFSKDNVVLSFIGRTRRTKGLEMFINLARSLPHPQARFLITGQRVGSRTPDSYTLDEILALVAQDPRIRYVGFREDIENIYATSDIIVVPSQADEPCPAVLIEAGAAGKPVIATCTGSTSEFIKNGENGFLVEREDLTAMTKCAERLISDVELRLSMGGHARRIVEQRFGRKPIEDIESVYMELI